MAEWDVFFSVSALLVDVVCILFSSNQDILLFMMELRLSNLLNPGKLCKITYQLTIPTVCMCFVYLIVSC